MRRLITLATIATFAVTTASAGGLSPEIMETPVVATEAAPAGSSINPAFVVVGVLAALLIASSLSDDEETDQKSPIEQCVECNVALR